MNNVLIAIIFILVVSVAISCNVGVVLTTDPSKVALAASEIAAFEIPERFHANFSAKLVGYKVAAYASDTNQGHMYLIQSAKVLDGEKLKSMLNKLTPGRKDVDTRMTIINTEMVEINDQETSLVISEGISSNGKTYRQGMAAFNSSSGQAMIVYSEGLDQWDRNELDLLLNSLH